MARYYLVTNLNDVISILVFDTKEVMEFIQYALLILISMLTKNGLLKLVVYFFIQKSVENVQHYNLTTNGKHPKTQAYRRPLSNSDSSPLQWKPGMFWPVSKLRACALQLLKYQLNYPQWIWFSSINGNDLYEIFKANWRFAIQLSQ